MAGVSGCGQSRHQLAEMAELNFFKVQHERTTKELCLSAQVQSYLYIYHSDTTQTAMFLSYGIICLFYRRRVHTTHAVSVKNSNR